MLEILALVYHLSRWLLVITILVVESQLVANLYVEHGHEMTESLLFLDCHHTLLQATDPLGTVPFSMVPYWAKEYYLCQFSYEF